MSAPHPPGEPGAPRPAQGTHQHASRTDPAYERLAGTPEFSELRHRYRGFAFPATVAFLTWYALYVVLSMWAHDFMSHELFGNVNVAIVFGFLQFLTTFLLAWIYARYSAKELDPLARRLDTQFREGA